jgi:lipopolysaccharide/colanic/teichoic acid biosynthesis glycosyltransferase
MLTRVEHEAMPWTHAACRATDVLIAAITLMVLAPAMALIALIIKLTSKGPVLFTQRRVGLKRKPFVFYKFRTMRTGADDSAHRALVVRELRGEITCNEGSWKLHADPRVTRVGAFLRRTSLDELPQLINVLRGDMAVVGPRPCLEWEAEFFPSEFGERFDVLPGLTGLWQVSGRSTLGTLDMLCLDVAYAQRKSLLGDLAIMARTIPVLVRGDGAR